MAVSILKFVKLMCRLSLFQSCFCASNLSIDDFFLDSTDILLDAKIVSDQIRLTVEGHPEIDATEHLEMLFDKRLTLDIGLYHKYYNFDANDYSDDNFVILIRLNQELGNIIKQKDIKSSEYIEKILMLFSGAKNLDVLALSDLYLEELPKSIFKFEKLRVLHLDDNELLDCEIGSNYLPNLQELKINSNKNLTSINESILSHSSLKIFDASKCSISKIPESIDKLENLIELSLCENKINAVPKSISNLKKLKLFSLSKCTLEEFSINMQDHPELSELYLGYSPYLKSLKLFIPETSTKIPVVGISKCPLINVEIYLNLQNFTKFNNVEYNDVELQNFDYVIKFDPNRLYESSKFSFSSEMKFFEYCLDSGVNGQGKNILIREFNPEIKRDLESQDKLIAKWTSICEKYNLDCENSFQKKFEHSINVIKNLYETETKNPSKWEDFVPFECKEKNIRIFSEFFDHLALRGSESLAKKVLESFKENYFEQRVYFNFLLKFLSNYSSNKINLLDFFKETIEILKDDAILSCLNQDELKLELYHKAKDEITWMRMKQKEEFSFWYDYKLLSFLFRVIMNSKLRFDSQITIEYLSSIIYNMLQKIGNDELIESQLVYLLLDNCEIKSEYFEYKTQSSTEVISKVNAKGIEALINSILNEYTPALNN